MVYGSKDHVGHKINSSSNTLEFYTQHLYKISGSNPEDKEYHLQMLVPIEDFALGHWKKTTLNIVNHKPQHKSKVSLWNAVNSHIRSRLIDVSLGIHI